MMLRAMAFVPLSATYVQSNLLQYSSQLLTRIPKRKKIGNWKLNQSRELVGSGRHAAEIDSYMWRQG